MNNIQITVAGSDAQLTQSQPIVAGTVGLPVVYHFDESWHTLEKVAVFRVGSRTMHRLGVQEQAVVPWELLEKPGCHLWAGVYGVNADGSLQIPTVWVDLGQIQPGAEPGTEESMDPTLPVWQQVYNSLDSKLEAAAESGRFTPKKGIDYYTEEDRASFVQQVLAALPDGDEVAY